MLHKVYSNFNQVNMKYGSPAGPWHNPSLNERIPDAPHTNRKMSRRGLGRKRIWGRDGGPGPWSGRGPGGIGRQGCRGGTGRAGGQGRASKAGCHQGGADNLERSVFFEWILWAPVPERFLEWICGVSDLSGLCGLPDRSGLCGLPERSGLWCGFCGLTETVRALEWAMQAHGTERVPRAHRTERALERAHGMERALEQAPRAHGTEYAGSQTGAGSGTGTAALGGASLGMPAARTDLMDGSSSLRIIPGIPGCAAASSATTGDTAASSAATGGAAASSPTTWGTPAPLNSTANLLTSLPCWRQVLRASNWRMRSYRGLEIVAGGGRHKPFLCWVLILADAFCQGSTGEMKARNQMQEDGSF